MKGQAAVKKVKLKQIAQKADVSVALVSQVLNNKEVRVSEETRKRILETAEEMRYVPNRMAAGLRSSKTNIIGCLVPDFNTPFYGKLINAIVLHVHNNGYQCMVYNTFDDAERQQMFLKLYASGLFDGMIIIPCDKAKNNDLYLAMKSSQFPYVFLYRNVPGVEALCVCEDGYLGGYQITKDFIDKGHTKIGFVSPEKYTNVSLVVQRKAGYLKAMQEHGLQAREFIAKDQVQPSDALWENLGKSDHCTASLISSSRNVFYVLSCLSGHGMHTPQDMEISVFGNFKLSFSNKEEINTAKTIVKAPNIIEMDAESMAKRAVDLLLSSIEKDRAES